MPTPYSRMQLITSELGSIAERYKRHYDQITDSDSYTGVPDAIERVSYRLTHLLDVLLTNSGFGIEFTGGAQPLLTEPAVRDHFDFTWQSNSRGFDVTLQFRETMLRPVIDGSTYAMYFGNSQQDMYVHGLTIARALKDGGGFAVTNSP